MSAKGTWPLENISQRVTPNEYTSDASVNVCVDPWCVGWGFVDVCLRGSLIPGVLDGDND